MVTSTHSDRGVARIHLPKDKRNDWRDGWCVAQDSSGTWQVYLCQGGRYAGKVKVTTTPGEVPEDRLARCRRIAEALERIYGGGA